MVAQYLVPDWSEVRVGHRSVCTILRFAG